MTRRDLISRVARVAGYSAGFLAMRSMDLLETPGEAEPLDLQPHVGRGTKIAILGGGIAGLVSAYELRKAGFECSVLEARDRPGGRNWTVRGGTRVEFMDGSVQRCDFDSGNYMNAGPARIPSIHKTMLGYCKELGVPLEVEVNSSRSAFVQSDKAFEGRPIEQREAINDARGHVSELLSKAIHQGALDQEITQDDRERMLAFLRIYGDLKPGNLYKGSARAGVRQLPGAGDMEEYDREPLPLKTLLDASFWRGLMFEETLDMQATMFQPVGGMDRIPYAFAHSLDKIVKYNSQVVELRKTSNGVRVIYREGAAGSTRSLDADYCICTLPLPVLRQTLNDCSSRVTSAWKDVRYDGAYKIAWESRRFWEQENNIYGGISWLSTGPIGTVWYPSANLFSEKGVLISGYGLDAGDFADLGSASKKIEASRMAVDKLHPGRGQELRKPVYVSWANIPFNQGSWVNRDAGYYATTYRELLAPDDRIYFAGDYLARVGAWQEGAALSAHRTIKMIADRVKQA